MDLPTGTSNAAPELASFTKKGLSSGRTPPPSLKLSKCTLAGDQWPVMSRTASISARGPQQYTWAVLGFSSTGQRSKARAGSPWLWWIRTRLLSSGAPSSSRKAAVSGKRVR